MSPIRKEIERNYETSYQEWGTYIKINSNEKLNQLT